jgi:DNA-binding transcriptional LysR family regulator
VFINNINNITFKQLNAFCTIANSGSITLAAKQLFVTKAAVSIALNTLEEQLGEVLFDRVRNRLMLNAQGAKLLPLADELLQRMQTIQSLFFDNRLTGKLRIGASVTIGNHLLPKLLAGFITQADCQRPDTHIENTTDLCAGLLNYDLDIALVEGRVYNEDLHVIPWLSDEMQIIASAQHPLSSLSKEKYNSQQAIENIDLADQKWVLREAHSGTREQFDQQLAPKIGNWSVGLEFNSNEAVINAVAAGVGLGFMSNLSITDAIGNQRIVALTRGDVCTRQLYIVLLKERYISPVLQYFLDYCLQWQMNIESSDKL